MLDDLLEIVAAVDEGRRHVLAEKAVGEEEARDDGERPSHQPAAGLEHQHHEHGAHHEIGMGEKARAPDQLLVEHPVVDPGAEADQPEPPEDCPRDRGPGEEVAHEAEAEKQQEAHMHRPHDLARQGAVARGPELEEREGDGDPEGHLAHDAGAEAGRQALGDFLVDIGGMNGGRGRPGGGRGCGHGCLRKDGAATARPEPRTGATGKGPGDAARAAADAVTGSDRSRGSISPRPDAAGSAAPRWPSRA